MQQNLEAEVGIGLNPLPRQLLRNSLNATRNPISISVTRGFIAFKNHLPELCHYSLTIVPLFLTIDLLELLLEVENQILNANWS